MHIQRVAVLFGGRSGEHEVSLVSAESVMKALDPDRYEIIPVGIDKMGRWWTGSGALELLREGAGSADPCTLPPEPGRGGILVFHEDGLRTQHVDVLFPVTHGTLGEDGSMQGLFELADIPYVGAGVAASAVAMDKVLQKRLHREAALPIADFLAFRSSDVKRSTDLVIDSCAQRLEFPLFVKPPSQGSSVGISKVHDVGQLRTAILLAAEYDVQVLVERAIPDAREIEVAVLGNEQPIASIPGEIIPNNEFYDYSAKYIDGASRLLIPAELDETTSARFRDLALKAFTALSCEGMARVDFLFSRRTGELVVNELNTIPGFTSISMFPKLFAASGIGYSELLDKLVELAHERHGRTTCLRRTFTPSKAWHRNDG